MPPQASDIFSIRYRNFAVVWRNLGASVFFTLPDSSKQADNSFMNSPEALQLSTSQ